MASRVEHPIVNYPIAGVVYPPAARAEAARALGPLPARLPAAVAIAERVDALLGPGLLLVAPTPAERGVEPAVGEPVEQGHGLQLVAAGARSRLLDDPTGIDGRLH